MRPSKRGMVASATLLLFTACGSLDNADPAGTSAGIQLLIQNPDESASGTAKAVDGPGHFSASKAANTLGVTSCDITCGSVSKTVSFASGAAEVSATVDCPTGSSVAINVTCADSDKTTNNINFGFTGSTTTSITGGDKITIAGRFLNQATRSTGDCRYARVAQDNNTQMFFECGASSALTDAQKTTFICNVEFQAGNTATAPSTVDTSSDGLQSTRGNSYIQIQGGLVAPSCFLYNTSDVKQLRGTGSWVTDGDGNTKGRCRFGVTQWLQRDDDRNARYAASCSVDGSTYVLIPSSGMAELKTSAATNSDVASLVANAASCSNANNCNSGWCLGDSTCNSLAARTFANDVSDLVGPPTADCGGDPLCPSGTANGAATSARFRGPAGLCLSPDGNSIYLMDETNDAVRKIDLTLASTSGSYVTTFAGVVETGGSNNGSCGGVTPALFDNPIGCVVNNNNDTVFVTERGNDTIRKITISPCSVALFAGTAGSTGFTNGTGSDARFTNPLGIDIDADDTLYVADGSNNAIRKITSGAVVTTLAGGCSGSNNGTGTAACFSAPIDVALDSTGTNLYVVDSSNSLIRIVNTATQVVTTLTLSSSLTAPNGLHIDPTDTYLCLTEGTGGETIKKIIIASGAVSTIAGSAGTAGFANGNGTSATFSDPNNCLFNLSGNTLYTSEALTNKFRSIQ